MSVMRLVLLMVAVLAAAGCARRATTYVAIDPATGQQVAMAPQTSAPIYAQAMPSAQQAQFSQPYAQAPAAPSSGRGLYGARSGRATYAQPQLQSPSVIQYTPPPDQQVYAAPTQGYVVAPNAGGPYVAPTYTAPGGYGAYAAAPTYQPPAYTLDAGDRLRVVVFGQDGLTNNYIVDAAGNVSLPLIGSVAARGLTPQQLSNAIANKLRHGYVREPHVSVEVEAYRPFFILGEVTNPGQYAYVPNMTAETAIAIAGGFSPRASKKSVELTRNVSGQQFHGKVPMNTPLRPGDTIKVPERWF
ncbi:MAG: polysaccharide biosynthesis/export family protein [Pseudolabrys sp.]